jgi:hypothetical protein
MVPRWIDECRQLVTESGDDLQEMVSRMLDRLSPDVLTAVRPDTPQSIQAALAGSTSGDEEAELFDDVTAGFVWAAIDLDHVASVVPQRQRHGRGPGFESRRAHGSPRRGGP